MSDPTSQSILEKFEFYFLALIFTLLGASIQTVNFSATPLIGVWGELTGWALLTISGLSGLSKVQWIVSILYTKASRKNIISLSTDLQLSQKNGMHYVTDAKSKQQRPIEEVIGMANESAKNYGVLLEKLGRKHEIKHHIQWWCFVIGLLSVGVSRGYSAIC